MRLRVLEKLGFGNKKLEQVLLEAEIAKLMKYPHLLQLIGLGEDKENFYFCY